MAIKASFIPGAGLLSVFGDDLDNAVTISRNAAGLILINGGAVQVLGGQPTVANTSQMLVFGQGGNDMLVLDESNGALPPAQMFGGNGNDTIVGGSGGDRVVAVAAEHLGRRQGAVAFVEHEHVVAALAEHQHL